MTNGEKSLRATLHPWLWTVNSWKIYQWFDHKIIIRIYLSIEMVGTERILKKK